MTSRVEELQRMCDNINENGGLDSGEWHTALLAQIAQNLAVIADVMMADRKTEQTEPEECEVCDRNEPQTDNGIGCSRCEGRFDCYDRDMPYAVRCNNYGKITDETQTEREDK